jgi:hypothetical protein
MAARISSVSGATLSCSLKSGMTMETIGIGSVTPGERWFGQTSFVHEWWEDGQSEIETGERWLVATGSGSGIFRRRK